MAVNSNENRNLLRQILQEHPLLKQNSNQFEQMLLHETNQIHNQRFDYKNNLTEMNKSILTIFSELSNMMQQPDQKPTQKSFQKPPPVDNPVSFEKRLKEQQSNFLNLAQPAKPKEIDFSDAVGGASTVLIPSMEDTNKKREEELRNIMKTYNNSNKNVSEWLGEASQKHIKIQEKTDIPLNPEIISKKVTFNITEKENNSSSFLEKLKKKTIDKDKNSKDNEQPFTSSNSNEYLPIIKEFLQTHKEILIAIKDLTKAIKGV